MRTSRYQYFRALSWWEPNSASDLNVGKYIDNWAQWFQCLFVCFNISLYSGRLRSDILLIVRSLSIKEEEILGSREDGRRYGGHWRNVEDLWYQHVFLSHWGNSELEREKLNIQEKARWVANGTDFFFFLWCRFLSRTQVDVCMRHVWEDRISSHAYLFIYPLQHIS